MVGARKHISAIDRSRGKLTVLVTGLGVELEAELDVDPCTRGFSRCVESA
jgi:transcription antitermination factor NusG